MIDEAYFLNDKNMKIRLNLSKSLDNAAIFFQQTKENSEIAEKYFLRAKNIKEHIMGEDHVETARIYHNLGVFYYKVKKNYKLAEEYLIKAANVREKRLGAKNIETAETFNCLAVVYKKGKKDQKNSEKYYSLAKKGLIDLNKEVNYNMERREYCRRAPKNIRDCLKYYDKGTVENAYALYWVALLDRWGESQIELYEKAIKIFEEHNFKIGHIYYEWGFGLLYQKFHHGILKQDCFCWFIENDFCLKGFVENFINHFKEKNDWNILSQILPENSKDEENKNR